jgi:hypothetical protein
MSKDFFFCVCDSCGGIEWIETIKEKERSKNNKEIIKETERVNELNREGEMKFKWKIDLYVYNKFSEMKLDEKRFFQKKKWFNEDYEDFICFGCEKRLNPIPFKDIDKAQRINIFYLSAEDRIEFAKNYKMVKVLEK